MAQQNEKQPKAKTGLARCLELASGISWCSWQVFWRRWLRSVLLYRTYQSTTSFGKSCLFTRICRS